MMYMLFLKVNIILEIKVHEIRDIIKEHAYGSLETSNHDFTRLTNVF